tara:strand:- start:31 stop:258 length:228 start_codon:yes stop_codon:yes gene_type:complete
MVKRNNLNPESISSTLNMLQKIIHLKVSGREGMLPNAFSTILLDGKRTTQAVTKMILMYNQSVLFPINQTSKSLL